MLKNAKKCDFTSRELFSKRDDDGFIILDDKILNFPDYSREIRGNEDRIKNWIETKDGKQYLIKTNACLGGEENYTHYAELLSMKIAEKMGLEYAKYDIVKFNGDEGIISENMLQKDEYLMSLEEFIGGSQIHPDNMDIIDYPDVIRQLNKKLKEYGYNTEDAKKMMDEFSKRIVFDSIVGAIDRHAENISFIGKNGDDKTIRFSPIYDTENSLLLENTKDIVMDMATKDDVCEEASEKIIPKIAIVPNKDAKAEDISLATFELAISPKDEDDYVLEDYASEVLEKLNIKEIIDEVETQINSTIPFQVKNVVSRCLSTRIKNLNDILCGLKEIDYDGKYIYDVKDRINNIRNKEEKKDIE